MNFQKVQPQNFQYTLPTQADFANSFEKKAELSRIFSNNLQNETTQIDYIIDTKNEQDPADPLNSAENKADQKDDWSNIITAPENVQYVQEEKQFLILPAKNLEKINQTPIKINLQPYDIEITTSFTHKIRSSSNSYVLNRNKSNQLMRNRSKTIEGRKPDSMAN